MTPPDLGTVLCIGTLLPGLEGPLLGFQPLADNDAQVITEIRLHLGGLSAPIVLIGTGQAATWALLAGCALPRIAGLVLISPVLIYPQTSPSRPAQPLDFLPGLRCPVQVHAPDADPSCPAPHLERFERRVAERGQVFRYPQAHAASVIANAAFRHRVQRFIDDTLGL